MLYITISLVLIICFALTLGTINYEVKKTRSNQVITTTFNKIDNWSKGHYHPIIKTQHSK